MPSITATHAWRESEATSLALQGRTTPYCGLYNRSGRLPRLYRNAYHSAYRLAAVGYPDRLRLGDCPYSDKVIASVTKTAEISDVRTARPTASPTPAGPPEAVKP